MIIGGAIYVYRHLGPGLLEHTDEVCREAALRPGLLGRFNVNDLAAGGWTRVHRRR